MMSGPIGLVLVVVLVIVVLAILASLLVCVTSARLLQVSSVPLPSSQSHVVPRTAPRSSRQAAIRELVQLVCGALEKENVEYHISSGTLLGLVRGDDIIEWDTDGDVIVMEEDAASALALMHVLVKQAEHCTRLYVSERPGLYRVHEKETGGWIDLFVYRRSEENDKIVPQSFVLRTFHSLFSTTNKCYNHPDFPTSSVFPTKKMKFWDKTHQLSVPHDYEAYLCQLYGADWRTPRKT